MSAAVVERPVRRRGTPRRQRRLPLEPLVELIEQRGGYEACAPGVGNRGDRRALDRSWERAKAEGAVALSMADRLAIKILGLHPMLVWGDDWLE